MKLVATGYAVADRQGKVVTFSADGLSHTNRALAIYDTRKTANKFRLLGTGEHVRKVRITVM